jgi:hypothetical protein
MKRSLTGAGRQQTSIGTHLRGIKCQKRKLEKETNQAPGSPLSHPLRSGEEWATNDAKKRTKTP